MSYRGETDVYIYALLVTVFIQVEQNWGDIKKLWYMYSIGSCGCVILYWLQGEIQQIIRYYMSTNINAEPGNTEYPGEKKIFPAISF